tara:strand:+ start:3402 stop:4406 length:1005 start_codon:yes stop_codon:yes gene_type:complete
MNIVITGAAGLLGSHLSKWLLDHTNHTVFGIDDLSGGYIDNVPEEVSLFKFDLAEDNSVDRLFKKIDPDIVYHFAAYAAEGLSPFMRSFNYKNNLIATSKVINACINYNVKRLVFTSSMAVYGNGVNGTKRPFDEQDSPSPIDPYGIAKMACEMDIMVAGKQHNLDWSIIRPHNVYGEKQNIWDKYRNVLGIWMYQFLNKESMTIFGDGKQTRAFSYIGDCVEPLYKAGFEDKASKEIINLGGNKFYSIKKANEILKEVIGEGEAVHKEPRHEVKDAYPTWQKSMDLIDFEFKTDLPEGLKKMWEWAKLQPNKKRKFWDNYEVEKGIYEFWKTP